MYHFIDTPGRRRYVHNTIRGIAQADAALLLISARKHDDFPDGRDTFESGLGPDGQTKEHILIA